MSRRLFLGREKSYTQEVLAIAGGLALVALVLIPSSAPAYNTYFGNFHSHSSLSDGAGPPDQAFAYARDVADIDILALSDHTHMTSQAEWETLGDAAAEYTDDGNYVALQSQEFGILNDFGHINIHGAEFRNPSATTNLPATYNFIQNQNAVGAFCHPNPIYGTWFDDFTYYPEYEDVIVGIEVVNGFYSGDYMNEWIFAMDLGWKLAPFGNQDNHQADWGAAQNPNDGNRIYLTGILADSLTTDHVLDALRARRFFAIQERPPGERIELEFEINGNIMGSEIIVGGAALITAQARSTNGTGLFNRIELYRDGVLLDDHFEVGTEISATFVDGTTEGEEHYYFIRARQLDGDMAWSAPIWTTTEIDPSAVDEVEPELSYITLLPNRPNPFGQETEIRFALPSLAEQGDHQVSLRIHDATGRLVRDLGTRNLGAGEQGWIWDGLTEDGAAPAGVYLYRLTGAGLGEKTGRMVRLSE